MNFNWIRKNGDKITKLNIQFSVSKHRIAMIIAEYVSVDNKQMITNFVKETTTKWTKAGIEKLVRKSFYVNGINCLDTLEYTDEQIQIAYKIVNKLWR